MSSRALRFDPEWIEWARDLSGVAWVIRHAWGVLGALASRFQRKAGGKLEPPTIRVDMGGVKVRTQVTWNIQPMVNDLRES